jgi:DNA-binding MarR family transcriptional regulator
VTTPTARWRRLDREHARLTVALDKAVRAEHKLTVAETELLHEVAVSHHGHLRMQRLAEAVGMPQSSTSRLVAKLEDTGLLTRYVCPDDRRGVFTKITPAGRDKLKELQKTYASVLGNMIS